MLDAGQHARAADRDLACHTGETAALRGDIHIGGLLLEPCAAGEIASHCPPSALESVCGERLRCCPVAAVTFAADAYVATLAPASLTSLSIRRPALSQKGMICVDLRDSKV